MTLADELMGRIEVAEMPEAPRTVNRIDDEDMHRNSIRYEDPDGELIIPEPAIAPFIGVGAKGEILCQRLVIDRKCSANARRRS